MLASTIYPVAKRSVKSWYATSFIIVWDDSLITLCVVIVASIVRPAAVGSILCKRNRSSESVC